MPERLRRGLQNLRKTVQFRPIPPIQTLACEITMDPQINLMISYLKEKKDSDIYTKPYMMNLRYTLLEYTKNADRNKLASYLNDLDYSEFNPKVSDLLKSLTE